jgi:hypothetical protein
MNSPSVLPRATSDQALWKGVLGTSLRATYVMYPYRESHGTRALSSQECQLYMHYLYTTRKRM